MPFTSPDDFLWEATGHATSTTSVVVTHPDAGGTTDGSTVLIYMRSAGVTSMTPPAGWVRDYIGIATTGLIAFRLDRAAAAETSWTFTRTPSGNTGWYMAEAAHLDVDSVEVISAGSVGTNATGTTRSTATTALNAGSSGVAVAVFGSTKAAAGDTHSWASYTNSFSERADFNPAGVAGQCIAIAAVTFAAQSTFETTATFTTSTGTPATAAIVLVYRSSDADINAPLAYCTGFEWGTPGGMGNTTGSTPHGGAAAPGTYDVNVRILAGAAKTGGFGCEVTNSATSHGAYLPVMSSTPNVNFSCAVKPVSGSGTPVAVWLQLSGTHLQLLYDVTNEKFGLQWLSAAAPQWQTGTTPIGTYPYVCIRARGDTSVYHAEWWIETGTGDGFQTSPADLTGKSIATTINVACGVPVTAAQTGVFHYDDVVYSRYYAAWPLGAHTVSLLVPETTGATVSGTSTNFSRFTSNGTLAAVNGTEGALLDEVPPTISASSDGVVQTATAASDYLNLPMTTLTLDPNEIIAGVRMVAPLWSGTGSGSGDLAIRGYDGLTETALATASQILPGSPTAATATAPIWRAAMWSGATNGAWNPTRLAAAALRVGFSGDATPDMGVSALYLEVATRTIVTSWTVHRLTDDEDPEVNAAVVTETLHPYNSGVRVFSVSNDNPTRTAVFNYSIGGTPQTPVVVAPSDPPVDVTVGAEAFGEVDSTSFSWQ